MNAFLMLLTLAGYFGLLLVVSRCVGRKADNDTFFRGNRSSPWYLVAFGMIGASLSGVSFVSVPGMVNVVGMTYLQMCMGFFFGYLVVAYVLLPLYYRLGLTSIYSYLDTRFGSRSYRTGAAFFLLSKTTGAAARLYLTCLILQRFVFDALGIPYVGTVLVTLLLVWLYTHRGGIRALVWTDSFQTFILLFAVCALLVVTVRTLGLTFGEAWQAVVQSPYSKIFEWDDWTSKQYFWKQFLSGVFIVVVMTGLDQDMMQKNLTCRNLKDAQKDMCVYGFCFLPVNALFLGLGILLYLLSVQVGQTPPLGGDDLLPVLTAQGYLGQGVIVLFTIGIVAAAFSSVDSALTALTTTFCIDILGIERWNYPAEKAVRIRRGVHLAFIGFFVCFTLLFKALNSTSVIDVIYVLASYTYGPLLGLFAFGLFSTRMPRDRYVPFVALAVPVFCYLLDGWTFRCFGYRFGYELLMFNGLLTALGLYALSAGRSARACGRIR